MCIALSYSFKIDASLQGVLDVGPVGRTTMTRVRDAVKHFGGLRRRNLPTVCLGAF